MAGLRVEIPRSLNRAIVFSRRIVELYADPKTLGKGGVADEANHADAAVIKLNDLANFQIGVPHCEFRCGWIGAKRLARSMRRRSLFAASYELFI